MKPSLDASSRREFLKAVVAVGGSSALAACVERTGKSDIPSGSKTQSSLPERQHAWGEQLRKGENGNTIPPRHRILRFMNLPGDGPPTEQDRETVSNALRTLETAYKWSYDGVLFTIGYSPSYFDRFGSSPDGVDLPEPKPLADFESPELDTYDAVVHLASDNPQAIVEAEEGLFGDEDSINGVGVTDRFTDVFDAPTDYPARRTGFVGEGLPARMAKKVPDVPDDKVPEKAPLFMGFESAFEKNQADEDRVTISSGPFAGGTTSQISALDLNLNQWWNQDSRWQRVAKMFSPTHAEDSLVEGVGENLGTDSAMAKANSKEAAASEFALVGHSQKMVEAREDGEPLILRRDFDTTDGGDAGLHFLSLQQTISDFVKTRKAMNGSKVAESSPVGQRNNNGILQYLRTRRRGNYLLPPRSKYALPTPSH